MIATWVVSNASEILFIVLDGLAARRGAVHSISKPIKDVKLKIISNPNSLWLATT